MHANSRKSSYVRTSLVAVAVFVAGLAATLTAEAAARRDAPLIAAVKAVDVDTVRSLVVDQGADVNQTAPDGATALHWAVHKNDAGLVDLLARSRSRRLGSKPLRRAPDFAGGGERQRRDPGGAARRRGRSRTPPCRRARRVLMTAARTGNAAAIRVLLVRGADPNLRDGFRGQTALMWAAARNNADAVHALAELGADLHAKTETVERAPGGNRLFYAPPPTGFTALLFAARGGHIDAVQVLLAAGADINDTLSDGQSALVVAVANANWELADYLLDRGADPNLAGAGWNALHQIARTRRMNTGFGFPGPIPSGSVDSIDVLKKMIDVGGDVNARMTTNGMKDGQRNRLNRLGATPFFLAAKVTDTEAMRVLLDAGADATVPSADGTTPLMVASGVAIWNPGEDGGSLPGQEDEVLEAVKLCLEHGNDINAANYRGMTALHGAAFRGANNVVEYLVEQGADLNARTDLGYSPLAIADGFSYSDFYKAQKHTAALPPADHGGARRFHRRRGPRRPRHPLLRLPADPPRSDRGACRVGGGARGGVQGAAPGSEVDGTRVAQQVRCARSITGQESLYVACSNPPPIPPTWRRTGPSAWHVVKFFCSKT